MTLPLSTVLLLSCEVVPTLRPSSSMRLRATCSVWFSTSGTLTFSDAWVCSSVPGLVAAWFEQLLQLVSAKKRMAAMTITTTTVMPAIAPPLMPPRCWATLRLRRSVVVFMPTPPAPTPPMPFAPAMRPVCPMRWVAPRPSSRTRRWVPVVPPRRVEVRPASPGLSICVAVPLPARRVVGAAPA